MIMNTTNMTSKLSIATTIATTTSPLPSSVSRTSKITTTTNYSISGIKYKQQGRRRRHGGRSGRQLKQQTLKAKSSKNNFTHQSTGMTMSSTALLADPHHYVATTSNDDSFAPVGTSELPPLSLAKFKRNTTTTTSATKTSTAQMRHTTSVAIGLMSILLWHAMLSVVATMAASGYIDSSSNKEDIAMNADNNSISTNTSTSDFTILVDTVTSSSSSSSSSSSLTTELSPVGSVLTSSGSINAVSIGYVTAPSADASAIGGDGSSTSATSYVASSDSISFSNDTDVANTEEAESASEYIFDRTDVRIIFITLYTMVFCCCFFGNLLVILVVTLSRRLRSITNFFLANLALADFCVGLFCVMQNLSIYLIDSWVFGEFLCRMYQFVHSLSYTASIFILVVICMERYFAIVHPITCKQILTGTRLRMVILTVWITSAVYSTPKFVFSKTIKNIHTEDGQEEEICVLDRKMFNSKMLDIINFVLLYVIPLLVMTVLYSKIAIALWRSSRGLSPHSTAAAAHHMSESGGGGGMSMHNSMYHHHHHHAHHHVHHQLPTAQSNLGQQTPGTPISGSSSMLGATGNGGGGSGSGGGGGISLSRKQSSKYEKRGVSITESQLDNNCKVSLDADRPVVTACRKTSFYQHSHVHGTRLGNSRGGSGTGGGSSMGASHMSHSTNNVLRARRGVVRMLIIFVLTFALCNLPYHARKMWQYWSRSYRGDSNFNALLTPLTFLVTYFNSGINPLLYAFLSRNFRKGMKELLLCSWKKGKGKSSSNSSMHHKRKALQTRRTLAMSNYDDDGGRFNSNFSNINAHNQLASSNR